jgi:hypothetical protein
MALIFQNLAVFAFFGVSLALHRLAVGGEERKLAEIFGPAYLAYCRQVPRFIPSPGNWRAVLDRQGLVISWRHLGRTMADSSAYLLALPVVELLEVGYANGILPLG